MVQFSTPRFPAVAVDLYDPHVVRAENLPVWVDDKSKIISTKKKEARGKSSFAHLFLLATEFDLPVLNLECPDIWYNPK